MRDRVSTSGLRPELLQIAQATAQEKGIDREDVMEAMEMAIQKVARTRYGMDLDIQVNICRKTGQISIERVRRIVEEINQEVEGQEISLEEARALNPDAKIGGEIREVLPPVELGRVAAQAGKQIILQRMRDAEREKQYFEFKDRVGDILFGIVKRVDFNGITVDLGGKAEAVLRREEIIPRENFRVGDRVRAFVMDVRRESRGPQIFLSRTHPGFMAKLFAQEVPEIYDGIIQIKAVARDPGSRAKIAVYCGDPSIDPVGSCVGVRGSRVQAVVNELQGEKVDIIPYSSDPSSLILNALTPAEVSKVILDEDRKSIDVIVPDDQLSIAIGRRGQNVRLASQLTGWNINISAESSESERRQEEVKTRTEEFVKALDVDEVLAHLLLNEGFTSLEEIAYVEQAELLGIEGFTPELAEELQNRAKDALTRQEETLLEEIKALNMDADLETLELPLEILRELGRSQIRSREDLADLSSDELMEILRKFEVDEEAANSLIMRARAHWFEN